MYILIKGILPAYFGMSLCYTLDYSFSLTVMPIYQCLYYFIQELDTRFYFQYLLVILRNLALIIMLEKPLGNVLCMIQKSIKDREKLMFNIRI